MPFTTHNSNDHNLPLSRLLFGPSGYQGRRWQMTLQERVALTFLLQQRQPRLAIEVGTSFGGALDVIAGLSAQVYSLDIDPTVVERLQEGHPEVNFLTGDSSQTLPGLLNNLRAEGHEPDFILLDGGHTTEALSADLQAVLRHDPQDLWLLMHDSFNPDCRKAILEADWAAAKHLQYLEVDFVSGIVHERDHLRDTMWGGLSLAIFAANPLTDATPVLNAGFQYQFDVLAARFQ